MKSLIQLVAAVAIVVTSAFAIAAQASAGEPVRASMKYYELGRTAQFRMKLPGPPESSTIPLQTGDVKIKGMLFNSSDNDLIAIVGDLYDLPFKSEQLTEKLKTDLFNMARDGIMEGITEELEKSGLDVRVKVGPTRRVSLSDLSGVEQSIKVGTLDGRARMLTAEDHIYIFLVFTLKEGKSNLIDSVLDSFEYIGNTI